MYTDWVIQSVYTLHINCIPGKRTGPPPSLRHGGCIRMLSNPESNILWQVADVKALVPYDWAKGHKRASDIFSLCGIFSVAFHLSLRALTLLQRESKRQYPPCSPLLPLRLSYTKAVSVTKLCQLSHITTQVRNALLGGGCWLWHGTRRHASKHGMRESSNPKSMLWWKLLLS